MTDPATLAPGELAEAVCRALGWVKRTHPDPSVIITRPWEAPNGERYKHPLDFHGPERWRSFGVVCDFVWEHGGVVEVREQYTEQSRYLAVCVGLHSVNTERGAQAPSEIPAALAIAYLRACAAEGGAT